MTIEEGRVEASWMEWAGGECPVAAHVRVHLRMRPLRTSGEPYAEMRRTYPAGDVTGWRHEGGAGDIIAYRPVPA